MTFAELPGEIFEAEVARMSHLIEQASSTMRAELMMPIQGRRIPGGLTGQVTFSLATADGTVTVPANTIAVRDGRQIAALVDAQGRVEFGPSLWPRSRQQHRGDIGAGGIADRARPCPNALLRQGDEVSVHVDMEAAGSEGSRWFCTSARVSPHLSSLRGEG